ncbi:arylsulfatase I-like [Babylonia areolata]|uniref:arylsulfatase I-like n=1 Tax=Babylonia areolata TaxID=304850 RepID=UPI003FD1F8CB
MADDLGSGDVSYRDPDMRTPNIDRLAAQGVTMTNSYMSYACTPSRAAFLTGLYGFRMGLQTQTMVFGAAKNNTLPLRFQLLPERLKKLNYRTHYVGKWHLGFCHKKATPTGRGFDTFYGMYNGKAGYFDHVSKKGGYDFHLDTGDNYTVDWGAKGRYSTSLFTERTVEILRTHANRDQPLFILLSYQAIHGPLQVPEEYKVRKCPHLKDYPERQTICGMAAAMDEGVGTVMRALEDLGYADDVITVFLSDNGGPIKSASSNYPLRGGKKTLWEGGTKVPTIVHSKRFLPDAPYQWNGLMHAVDWFPTLVGLADRNARLTGLDGVDNWRSIAHNRPSLRTELVYNIDLGDKNTSALRWNQWKLINNKPGSPDGWYNPARGGSYQAAPSRTYPEFLLFDLEKDPEERRNLLDEDQQLHLSEEQRAEVKDAFKVTRRRLEQWKRRVPPPMVATVCKGAIHHPAWLTGWCQEPAF